jgi:alginate O-acetyltransferase complex protein AlgI
LTVILASTVITWLSGLAIERASSRKRFLLIVSLFVNLGILFSFKYIPFLCESVSALLEFLQVPWTMPYASIILPLGISFYTFQAASYTIDVYKGEIRAEKISSPMHCSYQYHRNAPQGKAKQT